MIKSQLLYRLSYGLNCLIQQGIFRRFSTADIGRNGNGTYVYGTQRVTSIVTTLQPAANPLLKDQGSDVYYDESGWQQRLDTGDHAMIPPDSDTGLYILLGFILVGSAALFAASTYVLLGL